MGDKVSKIKKGIGKNLVKAIEFDESDDIDAQGITDIIQVLTSSNNTSVTRLHVTGPDILSDEVAKNAAIFFKSYHTDTIRVRVQQSLSLGFRRAKFESNGINRIFSSLMYCDIIGELIITLDSYNPFDQSNLDTLRTTLLASETGSGEPNKCKLNRLTIGGFAITPAIAKGFAELMSKQTHITQLSLTKWEMNSENIRVLVSEDRFEYLDLTGCEVGDDACKVIASAFERQHNGLSKLKKLILNENSISEKGVSHLIAGIQNSENGVINEIQLNNNNMTGDEEELVTLKNLLKERGGETSTEPTPDLKSILGNAVKGSVIENTNE
ncbi:NACHT, LRR and PYD domains-containing protein [Acrasis kona]|uniref:NACHT, LRR and PYD domains-containing protein n=1 Tax=Acrasis kona TaxID=1008807 RepID=A0AAW2YM37_9EUKA